MVNKSLFNYKIVLNESNIFDNGHVVSLSLLGDNEN